MAKRSKVVAAPQTPKGPLPTADDLGDLNLPDEAPAAADDKPKDYLGAGLAGLAGAARGATLGLSDLALTHIKTDMKGTPLVAPEELEKLKEEHPTASTVGELGGVLVPGLGEIGALGKLGKAGEATRLSAAIAGTPTTATSALGAAIEKATQEAIANKIAGKMVGSAAKTAAETLAYNAGQNLSEDILGQKDLTAENILAGSGRALAFGAGLGFGMGATGAALQKATQAASSSVDKLDAFMKRSVEQVKTTYIEHEAQKVATEGGLGIDEARKGIEGIINPITPEARDKMQTEFQTALRDSWKSTEQIKRNFWSEVRPKEVDALLADVDVKPAAQAAGGLLQKVDDTIARLKSDPTAFDQAYVRDLEGIKGKMQAKLVDEGVNNSGELYSLMNGLKKTELNDLSEWKRNLEGASRATNNSLREVRGLYRDFAGHLEDANLYGEAASRQASVNSAFEKLKSITDEKGSPFRKFFMEKEGKRYVLSTQKINTFMGKVGSARGGANSAMLAPEQALQDYIKAARNFADEVGRSNESAGVSSINHEGVKSLLDKVQGQHKEAADKLGAISKTRAYLFPTEASAGGAMHGAAPFLAGAAFGPAAAAAVGTVQNFTSRTKIIQTLSHLESWQLQATRTIKKSVDGFFSGGSSVLNAMDRSAAHPIFPKIAAELADITPLAHMTGDNTDEPKSQVASFRQAQAMLAAVQSTPDEIAAKLSQGLQKMGEHAPGVQQQMVATQMKALGFLATKIPKNPYEGYPGQEGKFMPSAAQMAQFERYVRAASDPNSVLHDMHKGMATPEGVETLKTVYPNLFQQVQKEFLSQPEQLEKLPYQKRLQLSMLFGIPLDPSLKPENLQAMQARFAGMQAPAQPGPPQTIKGPPLKTPSTFASVAQKREQRLAE